MKPYLIDDPDLASGSVIKREVDPSWLHAEMLLSAERLQSGDADNLDLRDADHNPTGAFLHQDVQTAFYELIATCSRTAVRSNNVSISDKRAAIFAVADVLGTAYING